MTSKSILRHFRQRVKIVPIVPAVLAISFLCGSCLRGAWIFAVEKEAVFAGIAALTAGSFIGLLVLFLIAEAGALWERIGRELRLADLTRCAVAACDKPLQRPYARENGRGVCLDCVRRFAREIDGEALLPQAGKAGA